MLVDWTVGLVVVVMDYSGVHGYEFVQWSVEELLIMGIYPV